MSIRSRSQRLVVPVLLAMLIGLIAGSATIVASDTSNYGIFRLGDAIDKTKIATVDSNGSLYVSQQGTVTATLTNTDFPDAATHTKLDSANGQLGKLNFDGNGNLRTVSQGTSQISGSVSVTNFPSDQQIHGTVTLSNPSASGVSLITLAIRQGVSSGGSAEWDDIDVSACRSFSVVVRAANNGFTSAPSITFLEVGATGIYADVHEKKGVNAVSGTATWGFPTQPGTNEPLYVTSFLLIAKNNDGSSATMDAWVYCQH